MKLHNERWWAQLTLSSRAQKAMRAVDRVDTVEFKNDTLEDFKVILKERRLFLLRQLRVLDQLSPARCLAVLVNQADRLFVC